MPPPDGDKNTNAKRQRGGSGDEKPIGLDDESWKAYLESKHEVQERAVRPRFAYRNWTDKDVEECRRQNPLHSAPGNLARLVPYTSPPSIDTLLASRDALWMLNVKPPWATALAYGLKDVENRDWNSNLAFEGERWTLIVASGKQTNQYAQEATADLFKRLNQSGQGEWSDKLPIKYHQFIVGLVKFRVFDFEQFTYDQRLCSVWYNGMHLDENGADLALYVEEAFPFPTPIQYTKGTLSMTRFETVSTPDLRDAVVEQLKLIGSTEPSAGPSAGPMNSDDDMEDEPAQAPTQAPTQGLSLSLPNLPAIPPLPTPAVMTQPISSLNEWGCMAFPIEYPQASITSFIDALNTGAQEWMANHLARALVDPPRKPELTPGHQIWQNTEPSIRQTILNYFDLRTRDGAIRLFDPTLRKASIPEAVRLYLNERLKYAKQGMNATAQGNVEKGWTLAGFGIWTRIWTSVGIKMLFKVKSMLMAEGFDTHISGVPHIIYKPPRGGNLPAHHDQMPTMTLIDNLRAHVKSDDSSVKAWASKHGIQLLAHIRGGYDDGYTYTVGPIDCQKLLFCMEVIRENPPDIAAVAWSGAKEASNKYDTFTTKQAGPYYADWYKLVGRDGTGPLNTHLLQRGYSALRIVPIRPFTNDGKPYLAMWPVGFPHGSMSNQEPRVTLTMNLTLKTVEFEPRAIERLNNLATLAHTGSTEAEVVAAEAAFKADTTPYHDGATHRMPEMMADLQRNAAYATDGKQIGPFASIAPTRDDVIELARVVNGAQE